MCYHKAMYIQEYVKKYGNLTIKREPFNYVDSVVLAHSAYLKFDGLIPQRGIKLSALASLYFEKYEYSDVPKKNGVLKDSQIFYLIKDFERYKDLKVYNYVSKLDKNRCEQFAALMIDLPDKTTLVIYRGTDGTMIGWREDFMLSYKNVDSQFDALKYLNRHTLPFHSYRVIGHSKGGNLGLYACVNANYFTRKRIKEIINLDGPSLRPGSYSQIKFNEFKDRYIKIVPESDIVGTIFDNEDNKIVTKSYLKGFLSHSGLSWQVDEKGYKDVKFLTKESKTIAEAIKTFYKETSESQREEFIDRLFECIDDENIYTLNELLDNEPNKLIKIFNKAISKNISAKKAASKLLKVVTTALSNIAFIKMLEEAKKVKKRIKKK